MRVLASNCKLRTGGVRGIAGAIFFVLFILRIQGGGARAQSAPETIPAPGPASLPAAAAGPVYDIPAIQVLGKSGDVTIENGGLGSAITADPRAKNAFYLLSDSGPNWHHAAKKPGFQLITNYRPSIARVEIRGEKLIITNVIALEHARDPEGLVAMSDGSFWVAEENGPAMVHYSSDGKVISQLTPRDDRAGELPGVLSHRGANHGMEGLTKSPDESLLIGMMQAPLDNPDKSAGGDSRIVRMIIYDRVAKKSRQYLYSLERKDHLVSDLAAASPTLFYVIERDTRMPADADRPAKFKKVFRVDISNCKDASDVNNSINGWMMKDRTLEEMKLGDLQKAGMIATKTPLLDLLALGYPHDKPEGICIISPTQVAISNDDDFGIITDGDGGIREKLVPGLRETKDRGTIRIFTIPAAAPPVK